MLISIVIPCYCSEKTLPAVVEEIRSEFEKRPEHDYQLILVNDGSPDDGATYRTIRQLCAEDLKITGVELSRNFGQARARMAALPYIQGDCAVYMDDDGQHPAEGIFSLMDKLNEGFDVVYAEFLHKKHTLFKRATSAIFRKTLESLNVKPKGIRTSSFFAWSRFAVDALKNYHSPSPSAGSFLLTVTARFANVDIAHRSRLAGASGYTLQKMVSLALTTMTNFTLVPLRATAVVGTVIAAIGFLAGIILIIRKLINPAVAMGYTSTMAVNLLLGGLILIVLGIIGEYIGRIYMVLSDMPQYRIREIISQADDSVEEERAGYGAH